MCTSSAAYSPGSSAFPLDMVVVNVSPGSQTATFEDQRESVRSSRPSPKLRVVFDVYTQQPDAARYLGDRTALNQPPKKILNRFESRRKRRCTTLAESSPSSSSRYNTIISSCFCFPYILRVWKEEVCYCDWCDIHLQYIYKLVSKAR